MPQFTRNAAVAFAAVLIMATSFAAVTSVPHGSAFAAASAPSLA